MNSGKKAARRLALAVILPAVIVLFGALGTSFVSLNEMANLVDHTETDLTHRSLQAALDANTRRMAKTVADYAKWDDAVRRLYGTPDPRFVEESLVASTSEANFFDTAYVLDKSGGSLLAYHDGEPTDVPARRAFGLSLDAMLSTLPADGKAFDARSTIVSGEWGLAIVGVGPIVPASDNIVVRDPVRYLVLAKRFDQATLDLIGQDYLVSGLAIAPPSATNGVPMVDYAGQTVGRLTWTPRNLGTRAQIVTTPLALTMLLLLALAVLVLIGVAVNRIYRLGEKEQEARRAATHDGLTGLQNRAALVERLRSAIDTARRGGPAAALVYLDLDGFKEVNDTYGHAAGDRLLITIAEAFRRLCPGKLVVRIGGDEFAVLVEGENANANAAATAEALVEFFHRRLEVDGWLVSLSTSIGVVSIGGGEAGVDEMLRRADVAMYRAKQLGRDRICVFEPELDATRARRTAISNALDISLADGSLSLAYQPIFDARTMKIVAAEALLRWPDAPQDIGPHEYVAIAEETGLIDELGLWTLRQACTDAMAWPDIRIAVNVSPAQFRNPGFVGAVEQILRDTGLSPKRLEIEITETFLMGHSEQAETGIQALRRLGVTLALDDFGTGFSSIGYLRRFGFDKVKIDRTLVTQIDSDPQSQALVQATVHIGRALGLAVTAEGVETEGEAVLMRAAGCQELQGFHFARPEPATALTRRLDASAALARAG